MENRTGRFIAQRRKELKMTQKELAEKLGVTNKAVSKWETGVSNKRILRNNLCFPACKQKNIATKLRDTA